MFIIYSERWYSLRFWQDCIIKKAPLLVSDVSGLLIAPFPTAFPPAFCQINAILSLVLQISLESKVFGLDFSNPIGLAAGFDKDAECIAGMSKIGFGFVEIGSVTPKPQPGNDKPRVFRLSEDEGVINRCSIASWCNQLFRLKVNDLFFLSRYGFNSRGHEDVLTRMKQSGAYRRQNDGVVIGSNLGKNKTSEDAVADYVEGVKKFAPFSDYLVINVSRSETRPIFTHTRSNFTLKWQEKSVYSISVICIASVIRLTAHRCNSD